MSQYKCELQANYQKVIGQFLNAYPYITPQTASSIDSYCRTCALYLWSKFSVDAVKCADSINSICATNDCSHNYTYSQVKTCLDQIEAHKYSIPVPSFFSNIVEHDKKDGTNYSRRLASSFKLIFVLFSFIDHNIDSEKADMITHLYDNLSACCDLNRIAYFNDGIDVMDFVTENLHQSPAPKAEYADIIDNKVQPSVSLQRSDVQQSETAMEKLNKLVGLSSVKREIKEICDFAAIQQIRKEKGLPTSEISLHMVFSGNPGTGKTTVARLVAQIYKDIGVLSKGHLVEASAKDLVAGYVGQTAIKTSELIKKANGGILFIDEAYTIMDESGQGFGQEAIDTLLKEMEDLRGDFAVIIAGYDDLMESFVMSNPGLKSRFNKFIHFDDYTEAELWEIFHSLCANNAYKVDAEAEKLIDNYFTTICSQHGEDFANGRTVRNLFERIISKQASRIASSTDRSAEALSLILEQDVAQCVTADQASESFEEILASMNRLIGLDTVKEEITEIAYMAQYQQRRKEQGLTVPQVSLHLVFSGNPGTGKTTVARYVARIYKSLGLLSNGQLVETDRSGLVAGYVGQTAIKTHEIIDSAVGGVLFIDEAYTLAYGGGNDFGQEAIDILLKEMEDKRDDLVVIVAGYDDLMETFIESNPGLKSRFNRFVHFTDYSANEMVSMFTQLCDKNQYTLHAEALAAVHAYFEEASGKVIGNGRGVRNLFERTITQQAKRVLHNSHLCQEELSVITKSDILYALQKGD